MDAIFKTLGFSLLTFSFGVFGGGLFPLSLAMAQEKPKHEYKFEGSKIEGEREKPKDLYILPWQETALIKDQGFNEKILETLDKEAQDRYQFQKEIDYYKRLGVYPKEP